MFSHRRVRRVAGLLALCMLLAVVAAFTLTSWNRAVERHQYDLETRVVMGSQAVNAYLLSLEQSLAELGDRLQAEGREPQAVGLAPQVEVLLTRYQRIHPEFEVASVIDMYGNAVASLHTQMANAGTQPFFVDAKQHLVKGERMIVSRPYFSRVVPKWLINLRYGVRDATGQLRFTVGGGIDVARAHSFWKDVPLAPGADMGLLREDLYAVARYPIPPRISASIYERPQPGLLSDYLRENGFPPAGVTRGYSVAVGGDATVAFRRLKDYPIYFVSVNPASLLRTEWWSSAWPTYAALLALLVGGLVIARWTGRQQMALQREREARLTDLEALTLRLGQSKHELESAKARLEHANAELEAYMYSVSHDLRAPVRAIDGYSALLRDELAAPVHAGILPPETGRLLGLIRASTGRMGDLLNDLLDLSRYSTQDMSRDDIDMRAIVESVITELRADLCVDPGTGINGMRIDTGPLPHCRGDRTLMRQVWSNLIANAIKYSAKADAPHVRITFEDGAYCIADNGAGFDMTYVGKLFKLFSRLHGGREYPGTGVGLAIVKRIVERHGGSIQAEGTPGSGARFSFTVPG
jgi:signal transduction histidine kinase